MTPALVPFVRTVARRKRAWAALAIAAALLYLYTGIHARLTRGDSAAAAAETASRRVLVVSTPDNTSYPLHVVSLGGLGRRAQAYTSVAGIKWDVRRFGRAFFPTHLAGVREIGGERKGEAESATVYVANESEDGEIVVVRVVRDAAGAFKWTVGESVESGGSEPAFLTVLPDGRRIVVANFNSPTITLLSTGVGAGAGSKSHPRLTHLDTLPLPNLRGRHPTAHHPHQAVPHPYLASVLYVPDLGSGVVWRVRVGGDRLEVMDHVRVESEVGRGPRHAVVSEDGTTFILGLQDSSTLAIFALDPRTGRFEAAPPATFPTLPPAAQRHAAAYALSDVQLVDDLVVVANRRVRAPFDHPGAPPGSHVPFSVAWGDTLALFPLSPAPDARRQIARYHTASARTVRGAPVHVPLGCWHPHEILPLGGGLLAVSCVGAEGRGAGGVVVRLDGRKGSVVNRWEGSGAWGMTVLH